MYIILKNVLFKISNGSYYSVSKGLPILLNFSFLKMNVFSLIFYAFSLEE